MDSRPFSIPIAVVAVTAGLYLGKDFLMPLALAILIVFLLTPVTARLEALGLARIPAVLITTLGAFALIGLALYAMASQAFELANSLPRYKDNVMAKAAIFHSGQNSAITRVAETFQQLAEEFSRSDDTPPSSPAALPVQVVDQSRSYLTIVQQVAGPIVQPLGTAAIVIVFVIFMLLEREDLRDRFIHLIGRGRLRLTTQAMDETGRRVSRYLAAQLTVNVTYGLPVGLGLFLIGVPNALLWGLLSIVLRFLPYIGPWIAASFPLFLSIAVSPGWMPFVLTVALFLVIELVSNNVVEPWLYGASTGLSPIAIIVAAAFWTWLWGAGGLLLATPLTVCVAVMGKHVPALTFLDVLLGEEPPIAAEERFYQRLLSGDETELFDMVDQYASRGELVELYDSAILPALRHAQSDLSQGTITREEHHELIRRIEDVLCSLGDFPTTTTEDRGSFLLIPARTEGEELAARILAHVLAMKGVASAVVSFRTLASEMTTRLETRPWSAVVVSALTPRSQRTGETLLRRLGVLDPNRAMLAAWTETRPRTRHTPLAVVTTATDAARQLVEIARLDAPATTPDLSGDQLPDAARIVPQT